MRATCKCDEDSEFLWVGWVLSKIYQGIFKYSIPNDPIDP
jgi:hypothetical protein